MSLRHNLALYLGIHPGKENYQNPNLKNNVFDLNYTMAERCQRVEMAASRHTNLLVRLKKDLYSTADVYQYITVNAPAGRAPSGDVWPSLPSTT